MPPYKSSAMHITLVDESIPFDGYSASSRPLGGASTCGKASPAAKPVQSWLPSAPGTGRLPSPVSFMLQIHSH